MVWFVLLDAAGMLGFVGLVLKYVLLLLIRFVILLFIVDLNLQFTL